MKHIKGILTPANDYAVTENISRQINKAVTVNSLKSIIKKDQWEFGVIIINSVTISRSLNEAYEFIGALDKLIKSEGIADLSLSGTIMVILETYDIEPVMVRIHVESNTITYQQVSYNWTNSITYSDSASY